MSQTSADVNRSAAAASRWYRQPILWLGIAIFVASMAGCIWIIVVSSRYDDPPLPTHTHAVMGVPAHAQSKARPSP